MYRGLAILCAAAACGLVGWAGYSVLRPPAAAPARSEEGDLQTEPDGAGLTVEDADQDLGELPTGQHRIVFRVTNPTAGPGEFVGGTGGCRARCCFDPGTARVGLPAGRTSEIVGELGVTGVGPFEFAGNLYLNDGGHLRTVRFKLTGVGLAGGKLNAQP